MLGDGNKEKTPYKKGEQRRPTPEKRDKKIGLRVTKRQGVGLYIDCEPILEWTFPYLSTNLKD